MFKPPGIRLRWRTGAFATEVETDIGAVLQGASRSMPSLTWACGNYEPECFLFGGPLGMAAAHQLFARDSLLWVRALGEADYRRFAPVIAIEAARVLLQDALALESTEQWDVWCRVATAAGRARPPLPEWSNSTRLVQMLWDSKPIAPDPVLEALQDFRSSTLEIANDLQQAWSDEGSVSPRVSAAFAIVFSWNRGLIRSGLQTLFASAMSDPRVFILQ